MVECDARKHLFLRLTGGWAPLIFWLKARLCVVFVAQRLLSSDEDDGDGNYYYILLAMILLSVGGSGWDCS